MLIFELTTFINHPQIGLNYENDKIDSTSTFCILDPVASLARYLLWLLGQNLQGLGVGLVGVGEG